MNSKESNASKVEDQSIVTTFLLGRKRPDMLTRISFQMGFFCYITLFIWSLAGWFAFTYGWKVQLEKGLQVVQLIEDRATYFGFSQKEFQRKVSSFHMISMLSWFVSLISLLLLYRKESFFLYVMLTGHCLYLFSVNYMLGFNFFLTDIGWYEKLALLTTHVSGWICWIFQRNQKKGNSTLSSFSMHEE